VIEITETAAMEHRAKAIRTLTKLRNMGLQVAIDDFGTGYASLTNLWDLPIDILKIDRYFTNKIITEKKMGFVVRVLIDSAHALGCEVTAEGIETEEQKTWLTERGVDKGQGYHLFRPQAPDVINETYIHR
jgi:EAL domain-containing protein (putative c-di-GMP-specific phosphodiesterase class I)